MFLGRRPAADALRPLPNGGRRGGVGEEIERIGLAELRDRWLRLYKPANAILVVTGIVDPELVERGVRRLFGPIPAGERMPPSRPLADARPLRETTVLHVPRAEWVYREVGVCLAIAPPTVGSPKEFAAGLVLGQRLQRSVPNPLVSLLRDAARGDPPPVDMIEALRSVLTSRVESKPLEDAGMTFVFSTKRGMKPDETAAAEVRELLRRAGLGPVTKDDRWSARTDVVRPSTLGLDDRAYPCDVAFGMARRLELGIDAPAVAAALESLTPEDLAASAARRTAAVVVVPDAE